MRGCNKKKKAKYIVIVFFAIIILGRIFIPWALEPENFRDTKNKINSFINRYTIPDSYNAKSLIAVDLSNNNDFVSKRANEQQTPASLAKLFVIDLRRRQGLFRGKPPAGGVRYQPYAEDHGQGAAGAGAVPQPAEPCQRKARGQAPHAVRPA